MVPHAHQSLDQDVAVQQHQAAHELRGAGPALCSQPLTAAHQLLMRHLHPKARSLIHLLDCSFVHPFTHSLNHPIAHPIMCISNFSFSLVNTSPKSASPSQQHAE